MSETNERRELLRNLGRGAVLAGMTAVGVLLSKRGQISDQPPEDCTNPCAKCTIGEACTLPRAERRRELLGSVRGNNSAGDNNA